MKAIHHHHHDHQVHSRTAWILLFIGALSLAFNAFPVNDDVMRFFPASDVEMTLQTYIWYISQNIGWLAVYYLIWKITDHEVMLIFFLCQIVVFIDFMISYNSPIFQIWDAHYGFIQLSLIFKTGAIFIWKLS